MKQYTTGEEIANAITHGIGIIFSIVALVLMVVFAACFGNAWQVVSVSIYGSTLIILYTMSTLYHAVTNEKTKKVLRIFDHASVYLLIAGTYTPFTLVVLRQDGAIGWVIFGIVWGVALIGITTSYILIKKKHTKLQTLLYILLGWVVIWAFPNILDIMNINNTLAGVYWLLAGGILYTVGTVFYIMKMKRFFHSIWHIFVLLGSVCHFISVMFYVL